MTDHEGALGLAAASLDFELSSADRNELRIHLAACASCRAAADAMAIDARGSRTALGRRAA